MFLFKPIAIDLCLDVGTANTIRIAGDEVNTAIVEYFRKEYNKKIGEITAEKLKI